MVTVYEKWSEFNSAIDADVISSVKLPIPVVHITHGAGKITKLESNCFSNNFDFLLTVEFDSGETKKYSYNITCALGHFTIDLDYEAEINNMIDTVIELWEKQVEHTAELWRIHAKEYLDAHKAKLHEELSEKKRSAKSFEKAKRKKPAETEDEE